ncbi:SDR family oxidoreductase [Mesorhizobium sp. M0220]|uniref:SDR family oxidoreductase n=1 Tax=unclassified Mesorhizobium TaxID=325217 RepID=UPI003335335B
MDRLEHDFGRILSGRVQRHVVGRMVSASRFDVDDRGPITPSDDNALKTRLREELLLPQTRLPITYATLAESMVGSDATRVIRDALEQPMDDDAQDKLGRVGELEDIIGAGVFLASDPAAMITGTSLLIDGGWQLSA